MLTIEHGANFGFDDLGERVPVTDFDFGALDVDPAEPGADLDDRTRREALVRLLRFLTDSAPTAKRAGQRLFLLAYLVRATDCRSQRQLARRLGISPGRVSQILNTLKTEFGRVLSSL